MNNRNYLTIANVALIAVIWVIGGLIVEAIPNLHLHRFLIFAVLASVIIIPANLYVEIRHCPKEFARKNTNRKMMKLVFTAAILMFIVACVTSFLTYGIFSFIELNRLDEKITFPALIDYAFKYFPLRTVLISALQGTVVVTVVASISIFAMNNLGASRKATGDHGQHN